MSRCGALSPQVWYEQIQGDFLPREFRGAGGFGLLRRRSLS
jgi:hypothetical protein